MKKSNDLFIILLVVWGIIGSANAQIRNIEVYEFPNLSEDNYRYHLVVPDIDGYKTLKCDFHIHTVFSDGKLWPDQRVEEAWNDGLDVIAITDHIEYRPNKELLISDLNKSYEIARKKGDNLGMIVIQGTEITRSKPFGHMNALFINDANKLDVEDPLDVIEEALKQNAFILWNHPGWPNDTSTIYSIHRELISKGKIHGVEVFNSFEVYPKVIDWCHELGLAPFANTDIHGISAQLYRGRFMRPMTLVFANEYSEEAVKEALFAGRTVACYNNTLSGKEEYLKALIKASLSVRVINAEKGSVEITNHSDITFQAQYGKLMYPMPLYPFQTIRTHLASGDEVTFTNCIKGMDQYVTIPLW